MRFFREELSPKPIVGFGMNGGEAVTGVPVGKKSICRGRAGSLWSVIQAT